MITTNIYIYISYISYIYIYIIYIYIIYIYHIYISYISYIYIYQKSQSYWRPGKQLSLSFRGQWLTVILLEVWHGFCGKLPWLVVDLPLWNMMDFVTVGMMTFPRYGKVKHVSNHQPVPHLHMHNSLHTQLHVPPCHAERPDVRGNAKVR